MENGDPFENEHVKKCGTKKCHEKEPIERNYPAKLFLVNSKVDLNGYPI